MKKITLFFALLVFTLGFAQTSNYCDTEVLHLDIPAETASAINLTIENTGSDTMKVTAAAEDITFLDIIGTPIAGGAATKSDPDTSVSGEISITLTWGTPPTGDVVFQFIQWRKTSTEGATWQKNDATTPFLGVCGPPPDPTEDATLSDLQVDGTTISGFSSATTNYTYPVPNGTTIVPQITLATPTQAGIGATASITQASAIPGDASVLVTAANGTDTATYTVSIEIEGPLTAASTPTVPDPQVKSIFSDAYNDIIVFGYGGEPNTYNTTWCGANTALVQVDGNNTNKTTGLGCEGIDFQAGRFDATNYDTFHIDIYTETPTQDKSFNIILSQWSGGTVQDVALEYSTTNASTPVALPANSEDNWISLDIPLDSFSNSGTRDDIVQIVLVSDLGTIWYDNLYFYSNNVLNVDCATPFPLTLDGNEITLSNVGAGDSGISASCDSGTINDVWFSFVASSNGQIFLETTAPNLSLWEGSCGSLSELNCSTTGNLTSSGLTQGNTYYLRLNDDGGARVAAPGTFTLRASDTALGTNNFNISDFSVSPNPTNDVWTVKGQQTIQRINVYDVLGKQVMEMTPNTAEVEISSSNLPKGLYFARMATELGSNSIKLIKN